MKNGSDTIRYTNARVSCSLMLIVKHLTKKRADAERKSGIGAERMRSYKKKRQYKKRW